MMAELVMKKYRNLMTSLRHDWVTPQNLFDLLNKEFNFTLDPCADEHNAKCQSYFTEHTDGLKQKWHGTVFMNPPYGREIGKWIEKAYNESLRGIIVVCLIPSRTDTRWWHDFVMKASEIRFIKGRLMFGGVKNSANRATFPSAVVVFKGREQNTILGG